MIPYDISLYSVKMRLIHSLAKGQWPWSEPIEGQSAAALHPSPYCWFSLIYLLCPCPMEASLYIQRRQCEMTATNCKKKKTIFFCLSHTNPVVFCPIFSAVETTWISVRQRTLIYWYIFLPSAVPLGSCHSTFLHLSINWLHLTYLLHPLWPHQLTLCPLSLHSYISPL